MGVDIYSCSGVPVTAKALARIVNEENKELAIRTLLRYSATLLQTLKNDANDDELDEQDRRSKRVMANFLLSEFRSLSIDSTLDDFQQMLVNMAPGVESGFDSHVSNSKEAVEIWGALIGVLFPGAPTPKNSLCIGSPRYQGNWSLPRGEAMFVFAGDECFEHIKTDAGNQLDSMLGKNTELATWTVYSC